MISFIFPFLSYHHHHHHHLTSSWSHISSFFTHLYPISCFYSRFFCILPFTPLPKHTFPTSPPLLLSHALSPLHLLLVFSYCPSCFLPLLTPFFFFSHLLHLFLHSFPHPSPLILFSSSLPSLFLSLIPLTAPRGQVCCC